MTDQATIWLPNAKTTALAGASLAQTLYTLPITIGLTGELGAGKTTFLQGLAKELGITSRITSPTFALEQRYQTKHFGEFLHLDLYRLTEKEANELVADSAENEGVRCIEWADRSAAVLANCTILIALTEEHSRTGRSLSITFQDAAIPSREEVLTWRKELELPELIGKHSDAVAAVCATLGEHLLKRGKLLRPMLLKRSAELHDLLRFVDFHPQHPKLFDPPTDAQHLLWASWKERYPGMIHEAAAAAFLREHRFPAVAKIVETHGLRVPPHVHTTIEQILLFYADKRVKLDQVVSLQERFDDFTHRYGVDRIEESELWLRQSQKIERELFAGAPPV
ncbi:MAG: tRNA (adenosine(37)-N6)-threonylcarbamoyltransferase complex ATPase subunit type 1 TsaE [Candidatus Peribacteraceae bacterium]|nr:tRNA (adenosine(37)-N6)-threonylcarbamoyltransferase complex ATPase subunit type 1 TsaE [Candidatus Peribacteraceae bacterium]